MPSNRIFVVHGRNHAARDEMLRYLRALKLDPITWNQAVEMTKKAAPTTFEVVKAGIDAAQCTVVLMTGDDHARLRPEYGMEPLMSQPRPNVLFEAGWALATGGQERTVLVRFGGLREFSDISGLSMIDLDNSPEKREALANRLKSAGCIIRKNGSRYLDPSISGNFSLPTEPDDANSEVLERGGFTEFIVDSALSHSLSDFELEAEVVNYLTSSGSPNLKFNYLGALGAKNWLELSADPTYGHSELDTAIRNHAKDIVDACKINGQRVDFVSLGPGDGKLDLILLSAFKASATIAHYYPFDISIELLQSAVKNIIGSGARVKKDIKIKAIHGDFMELNKYRPIYCFDPAVNFLSLIGYTFGNYNEAELFGKLREGMETGDFLLVDARLHQEGTNMPQRPTKEQIAELTFSYNHSLNNAFAYGPVEATTISDANSVTFQYDVTSRYTAVPKAINIVTYVEDLRTKFRRSGKKLIKKRINLAATTIYDESELGSWFGGRGFDVIWRTKFRRTALYLLQKSVD